MAFGVVYAKLKKRTSLPSYVLLALGFLLMFLFPGKVMAIVACAFMPFPPVVLFFCSGNCLTG